jgi:hypothetical protein
MIITMNRWIVEHPIYRTGGLEMGERLGERQLPSGKRTKNYGKSPFSMGKSTINGHFNSYFDITRGYILCLFLKISTHS